MTERIYGTGAIQSPPDERDFPISDLYAAAGIEPVPPVAIPDAYRVPATLGPVLDQNGYPQCVAYSTSLVRTYQDRIDQGATFDFDEALFFRRIGGTDQGAFTREAMVEMLQVGYPVRGVDEAAKHRIAAYYNVPTTKIDIQQAILAFGPLVISTSWWNSWYRPSIGGVLPAPSGGSPGGHAIVAYGWEARGLRLMNSWGTDWGVGGSCIMPWAYAVAAWEAYKMVDRPTVKPPTVTLRYGGYAGFRGLWRTKYDRCRFRKSPYTNGVILATVAKGTEFRNYQTTDKGSLVAASRRWLGSADGNKWIHISLVEHV